jgi:hypothetical protein
VRWIEAVNGLISYRERVGAFSERDGVATFAERYQVARARVNGVVAIAEADRAIRSSVTVSLPLPATTVL